MLLDINGINGTHNVFKVRKDQRDSGKIIINMFMKRVVGISHGKVVHKGMNTVESCKVSWGTVQVSKGTMSSSDVVGDRILA